MIIDGNWRNKVRLMNAVGNKEEAKKELTKAKMSAEYSSVSPKNKIFINYCLALLFQGEENIDLTKKYIEEIELIFSNEDDIDKLRKEYCNYLWLKTNMDSENLTLGEITNNMNYIYEYYYEIGKYDKAIGAMANIYSLKKDGHMLLEKLKEFMECPEISDINFINSFLKDCDKISHNLYIEAVGIVNGYNGKFNIDIV